MTTAQTRPARAVRHAIVRNVTTVADDVVRVVLGGPGLTDLRLGDYSDTYVKLLFLPDGVEHPEPWDIGAIRSERPVAEWPVPRTYTVREHDRSRGEISLDVVVHGAVGFGGPWARRIRAGDGVHFLGPGGDWAPDVTAAWHLFVGDGTALPAIGEALARLSAGSVAVAVLDVADTELIPLSTAADLRLHRYDPARGGDRPAEILAALVGLDLPAGVPEAFVHGEADLVRAVRRWVRAELGVPRERLSASGYWRRGRTDEAWRAGKRDWKADVEGDDAALIG